MKEELTEREQELFNIVEKYWKLPTVSSFKGMAEYYNLIKELDNYVDYQYQKGKDYGQKLGKPLNFTDFNFSLITFLKDSNAT